MAVYFAAGEDEAFTSVGTVAINTTASHRRASWSRCALQANDGDSYWDTGNVMSVASAWFHARVWMTGRTTNLTNASPLNRAAIRIVDAAGITRLALIYFTSASNTPNTLATNWRFGKYTAAGTFTQLGSVLSGIFASSPAAPDAIDIQVVNYATAGAGEVRIWINETLVYEVTGATLATDSNTTINGIRLAGCIAATDGNKFDLGYSEVIIADSDTRTRGLATLAPAANGNTVNWTTGGVSNINETPLDDVTLNDSASAGQIQQYTIGALPSGVYGVEALIVSARAMAGSAGGPTKLDFGIRTNSIDYWSSDYTLAASLDNAQHIMATNPDTSAAFTTAEVGAAGFNIGMKSVA